jgi:hypothetical protein
MRLTILQYIGILILAVLIEYVKQIYDTNVYLQIIAIILMGIYYCYIKD